MFDKMKIRNRRQITMPILLSLFLAFTAIALITANSFWNTFLDNTSHSISQKKINLQLFMNLVEETSRQFSGIDTIAGETVSLENEDHVRNLLNNLTQINNIFLGAAFFYPDGRIITSSRTSAYPTLKQLKTVDEIKQFINSDQTESWTVRSDYIAKYYNNKFYNNLYGIVTYISKIKLIDNRSGYLLLDIDPQTLYRIFTDNNRQDLDIHAALINNRLEMLPNPQDAKTTESMDDTIRNKYGTSKDYALSLTNRQLIFYTSVCEDNKLAVLISFDSVIQQFAGLLIPLFIVFILLSVISIYIALLLTKTISTPLEALYHTMNNEMLDSSIGKKDTTHNEPES
mgnify:CR=1 FL=1